MQIHYGYESLDIKDPVVTMGIFDGVHRGHRTLLDKLVNSAAAAGGESVVITFDPHPRLVLEKDHRNLSFLSSMEEKSRLLEKAHIGHLVIVSFTKTFSRMESCDFVSEVLARKIGTRHIIIGYDHHFGHRGEGNINTINDCAASMGLLVEQVSGLRSKEGPISSSLIRDALLSGNLNDANKWLGYCYSLKGEVIAGRKLGREIGFPTANIKPSYQYKLVPADGVYAVDIRLGNETKPAMLSIGTNPTVNTIPGKRTIEAHIFDFGKEIYGEELEIIFRYRLRSEVRFGSVEELARQMEKDKAIAMKLLA